MKEHLLELEKTLSSLGKKTASNEVRYLLTRVAVAPAGLGSDVDQLAAQGRAAYAKLQEVYRLLKSESEEVMKRNLKTQTAKDITPYIQPVSAAWFKKAGTADFAGADGPKAFKDELTKAVGKWFKDNGVVNERYVKTWWPNFEQLASDFAEKLRLYHVYKRDWEYAKIKEKAPTEAPAEASPGVSAPGTVAKPKATQYRFSAEDDAERSGVKEVQRTLGLSGRSVDGWWGDGTDTAWDAKMDQLGKKEEKVGGENFPASLEEARTAAGAAPSEAPPGEAAKPKPEEGKEGEETPPDAGAATGLESAILGTLRFFDENDFANRGLTKEEGATPGEDFDTVAELRAENNPEGRDVALIEWLNAKDDPQYKYDMFVLEGGEWKLSEHVADKVTRTEQRALMRQYRGKRLAPGAGRGGMEGPSRKDRRKEKRRVRREMRRERGKRRGLFGKK
jgi:hypothetical protein